MKKKKNSDSNKRIAECQVRQMSVENKRKL